MSAPRRYRNPPIEEALCEFRFLPGMEWDLTMPGKLQGKLGGDYTGKPQEQRAYDVALQTQGGQPAAMKYGEGLLKVHLVTPDGKRKVGVGRDVLSVHMLRPYQHPERPDQRGWSEFRERIDSALRAYWSVAEPEGVTRIGIRYINKIVFPGLPVRIEEYITCATPDVQGLPDLIRNYASQSEYAYDSGERLVLSHGTVDTGPSQGGLLLDIDLIAERSEPVDRGEALRLADNLRDLERDAFEALITDKARDLFDVG